MSALASPAASVCRVVTPAGRVGTAVEVWTALTWQEAPAFRASVPELPEGSRLLIDLSHVPRMDSAGTGAVIATCLQAQRGGVEMAVLASGEVSSVLDRIGLAQLVPVFYDRQQAWDWMV